jgi:hypothetical protein
MKKIVLALIFGLLLFTPANVLSKDIIVNSEKQYQLARTLFENEEFAASACEFTRFVYLFPDDERVSEAAYKTGVAYFYAGMLKDAVRSLKKVSADFSDEGFSSDAMFKLSELYVSTKRPGEASSVLRDLLILTQNPRVYDRACYLLGWLLLDNADIFKTKGDFKAYPVAEAQTYFSKISPEGKKRYRIDGILGQLDTFSHVKKKSPVAAGFFSIIPGGGFLYCERYRDALVSFLLNSALMIASYQAFEDDNPFLGSAIAFVEAGFYAGNVYGSISSAHKYNKKKQHQFIGTIKQNHLNDRRESPVKAVITNNSAGFFFTYRF